MKPLSVHLLVEKNNDVNKNDGDGDGDGDGDNIMEIKGQ